MTELVNGTIDFLRTHIVLPKTLFLILVACMLVQLFINKFFYGSQSVRRTAVNIASQYIGLYYVSVLLNSLLKMNSVTVLYDMSWLFENHYVLTNILLYLSLEFSL